MLKYKHTLFLVKLAKKEIAVVSTRDFNEFYCKLRNSDPIKRKLVEVVDLMEKDRINGVYIKKKPWPKTYVKNHDVTNLYKYDIDSCRLIYTVKGLNNIKNYQILDFLTHKQ